MENNKYYTPTIEEFHVGFEFDINDTIPSSGKKEWSYGVKFSMAIANYVKLVLEKNPEDIRVKYLDKEDIESLGWKFTGKSIDIWFKKEGMFFAVSGGHKFTAYKLQYGLHDNRLKVEAFFAEESEGVLFEGIIKNKSELKRLMKQLGINND